MHLHSQRAQCPCSQQQFVHNCQKVEAGQAIQVFIDRWMYKQMKYYSAILRKEVLTHAVTWMALEDTVFSESSQSQMYKFVKFVTQGQILCDFAHIGHLKLSNS